MAELRRRVRFHLKLEADSWEACWRALDQIATDVARGNLRGPNAASGGILSCFTLTADEDESITHDSYFEALEAHLERKRDEADSAGSAN